MSRIKNMHYAAMLLYNTSGHTVTVDVNIGIGSKIRRYNSIVIESRKIGTGSSVDLCEIGHDLEVKFIVTLVKEDISGRH